MDGFSYLAINSQLSMTISGVFFYFVFEKKFKGKWILIYVNCFSAMVLFKMALRKRKNVLCCNHIL